jgi:CheY-like chemotaxis protein/HPt (histidine-containing phosphotransfer) domain-containing protein
MSTPPEEAPPGERPTPASFRILIVEDNPINLTMALAMLKRLGCRADAAGNGAEALEALSRAEYDLVIMDLQMPVMDGLQTAREWRRRESGGRRVPILALTADAVEGARDACLAAGMDEYVTKPIRLARMAEILRRYDPAVDASRLEELKTLAQDGDPGLLGELARSFAADLAPALAEIRSALDAGDLASSARAAHKLAGSSACVGMKALAESCSRLEAHARADDGARAKAAIAELETQAARALAALPLFTL